MLPTKNRLTNSSEIERVFKRGRRYLSQFLRIYVLDNTTGYNRFAFVVPKKLSKKAAIRNRVKRRVREIIRQEYKELLQESSRPMDVAIYFLADLKDAKGIELDYSTTKSLVEEKMRQTGLLQSK